MNHSSAKLSRSKIFLAVSIIGLVILCLFSAVVCVLFNSTIAATFVGPIASWVTVRPQSCSGYGSLVPGTYTTDLIEPFSKGFVISYSVQCAGSAPLSGPMIGYAVFERIQFQFVETNNGTSPLQPNQTFSFGGGHGVAWSNTSGINASAVFHGLIQDPAVAWVEISFADGQTMKSTSANKRFLFTNFFPVEPCLLQSLDQNGVILEKFELGDSPGQNPPGYVSCPP